MVDHTNRKLSRINFIASFGDFVSLFSVLVLIYQESGSVLLASYSAAVKSLGLGLGGLTFPKILSRVSPKRLLIVSQSLSALLMALLTLCAWKHCHAPTILTLLFFQAVLRQYFDGAKETYSKSLGSNPEQRTLQAQLLHGFYGAQFIGPIISFLLLKNFPVFLPMAIGTVSFLISAVMCSRMIEVESVESLQIFRPFRYLAHHPGLLRIFLIRSMGYWVPIGIFNYFRFSVITEHYHLQLIDSAWVDVFIGCGSLLAAIALVSPVQGNHPLLHRVRHNFAQLKDGEIAFVALTLLALTRVVFVSLPSIWLAVFAVTVGGFCNGMNAISTQSLRRKLTTQSQFPEVVGLEMVIARVTEYLVASACLYLASSGALTYTSGMWISAALLVVLGSLHLAKAFKI